MIDLRCCIPPLIKLSIYNGSIRDYNYLSIWVVESDPLSLYQYFDFLIVYINESIFKFIAFN